MPKFLGRDACARNKSLRTPREKNKRFNPYLDMGKQIF